MDDWGRMFRREEVVECLKVTELDINGHIHRATGVFRDKLNKYPFSEWLDLSLILILTEEWNSRKDRPSLKGLFLNY